MAGQSFEIEARRQVWNDVRVMPLVPVRPRGGVFLVAVLLGGSSLMIAQGGLTEDSHSCLMADRFQELEEYAAKCRSEQLKPDRLGPLPLERFYDEALRLPEDKDDSLHLDCLKHLEKWREACPNSITPRVALGHFYIGFAWKARGGGWAREVTEEGWKGFRDRLAKARAVFEEAEKLPAKDPEMYAQMIILAMGQSWPRERMEEVFSKGVALSPYYYALHFNKRCYLARKWHGQLGDWQIFSKQAADQIGGEPGDMLYARLVIAGMGEEKDALFKQTYADAAREMKLRFRGVLPVLTGEVVKAIMSQTLQHELLVDYERVKRGILAICKQESCKRWYYNLLAYFACLANDRKTALSMMCRVADEPAKNLWDGNGQPWEQWLNWADNEGRIARARTCEAQEKWEEAEKLYAALPAAPADNRLLDLFRYHHGRACERQGRYEDAEQEYLAISEGWRYRTNALKSLYFHFAKTDKLSDFIAKERAQWTPETAPADRKYFLMVDYLLLHDFEQARVFGTAFNKERPWNLNGYGVLYAIALHEGSAAAIEDIRNRALALKTDRKAYLYVQSLMRGEKTWGGPTPDLDPKDQYFRQAVFMIALDYQYQKRPDLRDAILKYGIEQVMTDQVYFPSSERHQLASLLYGALNFSP